jgi:hypothetical protein
MLWPEKKDPAVKIANPRAAFWIEKSYPISFPFDGFEVHVA